MATKAQYAAARKAHDAYQAAKSSWNTRKANSIYSSAAKSLWVSSTRANKIYNRNTWWSWTSWGFYSKSNYTAPTVNTVNKNITPYTPFTPTTTTTTTTNNLWYGDVNSSNRKQYTWLGIWLSGGKSVSDLSNFGGIGKAWQSYDRFGRAAEIMEAKNPWFLAKRNDSYIMELASKDKNFLNLDEFAQKEQIKNLLKQRDTRWELNTGQGWESDVQNTIDSIYARIGKTQQQQQDIQQEAPLTQEQQNLNTQLWDINDNYDLERRKLLRSWAVEDRFTNFNEVNDNIGKVLEIAGQDRADNMYTGTPTDEAIQRIAQKSGNDFATTKKILEGRWYEDLQLQDEYKKQVEMWFNRNADDLETQRQRDIQDTDSTHLRTQTALNEQIDDVQRQMERNIDAWEKAGALSGANRSSWYMQWLENIRQDALRQIDRLQTKKDWDTSDTAKIKGRIADDFTKNMTRNTENLKTTIDKLKIDSWMEINTYLWDMSMSSEFLTRKLREVANKYWILSNQAIQEYNKTMRDDVDTMTYKTEKMLNLQTKQQYLQQTNVTNLLKDNWAALAWINYDSLNTMLLKWDISPTDIVTMKWYMSSIWISTLQSMWIPTKQDIQLYNSLLDQNMTPSQAITAVTSASPDRFTQTAGQWEWKLNTSTGEYYRTGVDWNLEIWAWGVEDNNMRSNIITTKIGAEDWDADVTVWQQITAPVAWQITALDVHNDGNVSMEIMSDGYKVELNHLDPSIMDYKDQLINKNISVWDVIWIWWNSWDVMTAWGTRLRKDWVIQPVTIWEWQYAGMTAEQALAKWAWSHLDMRVVDVDWNIMSWAEAKQFIEGKASWGIYNTLSNTDKDFVDWLVEYKYNLPSRASKNYKTIMAAAVEKDPSFVASEYANRKSFKNTWDKKRIAGWNLSKVATAVQHLWELQKLADELQWQSKLQIKNKISNRAKEQYGNPSITKFNEAAAAVTSELAWAYKGTASPSESDREERGNLVWLELSPKQLDAYVDTASHLLFWKINTEALAYSDVMGTKPKSIFTQDWYNFLVSKGLPVWSYFETPSIMWWWQTGWQEDPSTNIWGNISDIR